MRTLENHHLCPNINKPEAVADHRLQTGHILILGRRTHPSKANFAARDPEDFLRCNINKSEADAVDQTVTSGFQPELRDQFVNGSDNTIWLSTMIHEGEQKENTF